MSTAIAHVFERCARERRAALIAYLMAGFPSMKQTPGLIRAALAGGADIIELGIPYSDPLADGPSIQAAAQRALNGGASFDAMLDCVESLNAGRLGAPLLAFSYYNPLYVRGLERCAQDLAAAGFAGAIVPDLPPEEAQPLLSAFEPRGLSVTFLVAPTTPPERARTVAAQCTDFVYVVSRMGVTGADRAIGAGVRELVERLRALTAKPLAVGFGVSSPEQVATVAAVADGVVVGSALVDCIARSPHPARNLQSLCASLRAACAASGSGNRSSPSVTP
jgi:tryptophan synthase alpha chain